MTFQEQFEKIYNERVKSIPHFYAYSNAQLEEGIKKCSEKFNKSFQKKDFSALYFGLFVIKGQEDKIEKELSRAVEDARQIHFYSLVESLGSPEMAAKKICSYEYHNLEVGISFEFGMYKANIRSYKYHFPAAFSEDAVLEYTQEAHELFCEANGI